MPSTEIFSNSCLLVPALLTHAGHIKHMIFFYWFVVYKERMWLSTPMMAFVLFLLCRHCCLLPASCLLSLFPSLPLQTVAVSMVYVTTVLAVEGCASRVHVPLASKVASAMSPWETVDP